MHQSNDLLREGPRVHRRFFKRPRMLQHGQEVETLPAHTDQIER